MPTGELEVVWWMERPRTGSKLLRSKRVWPLMIPEGRRDREQYVRDIVRRDFPGWEFVGFCVRLYMQEVSDEPTDAV